MWWLIITAANCLKELVLMSYPTHTAFKKKKKKEQGAQYWSEKLDYWLQRVKTVTFPVSSRSGRQTCFSVTLRTKSESPAADGRTSRTVKGRLKIIKRSGVFIRLEDAEIQELSKSVNHDLAGPNTIHMHVVTIYYIRHVLDCIPVFALIFAP